MLLAPSADARQRAHAARLADPAVQRQMADLDALFAAHRSRLAAEAVRAEPMVSADDLLAEMGRRIGAWAAV